jgi:hypothetical protein
MKELIKFLSGAKKSWYWNEEGKRRKKMEREKRKGSCKKT